MKNNQAKSNRHETENTKIMSDIAYLLHPPKKKS